MFEGYQSQSIFCPRASFLQTCVLTGDPCWAVVVVPFLPSETLEKYIKNPLPW